MATNAPDKAAGSRDLYLHLGFPKTATTAFQRSVFSRDDRLAYLGKSSRSAAANEAAETVVDRLLWSSERFWKERGDGITGQLRDAADGLPANGPLLISDERLLGGCLGVLKVANRWQEGRFVGLDPDALSERIAAFSRYTWPEGRVRVLMTLRRQDHFLASLFAQTFLWRRTGGIDTFEDFAKRMVERDYYSMGGVTLDYDGLIGRFEQALGPSSVEVLFYEDLGGNLDAVAETLERTVHADPAVVHEALNKPQFKVRRRGGESWTVQRYRGNNRLRHVLAYVGDRLRGRKAPAVAAMTPEMSRTILERYAESNRRLEQRIGRDLSAYGYRTPS